MGLYYNISSFAASFVDGPSIGHSMVIRWMTWGYPLQRAGLQLLGYTLEVDKHTHCGETYAGESGLCGSRVAFGRGFQRRFDLQMGDQVEIKYGDFGTTQVLWLKIPVGPW